MKKIFILPVLALLFAGCSDNDNNQPEDELIPISLSSSLVVVQPRASSQDTQIAAGQQVSFFVTKTDNTNDVVYNNALLTANGTGGFTYSYQGENVLYYPLDNESVNFYAVHPYSANNSLSNTLAFEVPHNQALINDYLNSDLLYSQVTGIQRSRNTVPLTFTHKLSNIRFIIRQGVGTDLSQLNAVNVLNIETGIDINLTNGQLVPKTNTPTTVNAYGVRGANAEETEIDGIAAIIVPQTFTAAATKPLFQFRVGGTDFFYTPTADITFETGLLYQYTITINDTGINVSSEITDWIYGGNTSGEGVLP